MSQHRVFFSGMLYSDKTLEEHVVVFIQHQEKYFTGGQPNKRLIHPTMTLAQITHCHK